MLKLPGFFPGDLGLGMFVMSLSTGGTLGNVGSCKVVPTLVVVISRVFYAQNLCLTEPTAPD